MAKSKQRKNHKRNLDARNARIQAEVASILQDIRANKTPEVIAPKQQEYNSGYAGVSLPNITETRLKWK